MVITIERECQGYGREGRPDSGWELLDVHFTSCKVNEGEFCLRLMALQCECTKHY